MKKSKYMKFIFLGVFLTLTVMVKIVTASVTVAIPDSRGAIGSSVNIPINVISAKDLGALQLEVSYDPAVLEPVSVDPGELLSGLVDFNVISPGRLRIAMVTNEAINGDGELIVMQVKVLGGQQTKIELEEASAWEQSTSYEMMVTVKPGTLIVSGAKFPVWLLGLIALVAVIIVALIVKKLTSKGQTS